MTTTDTLSGIARDVSALTRTPTSYQEHGGDYGARALAGRLEAFTAATPGLDPETRTRYLVRLARCIDPTCPADPDAALRVLGLTTPAEEGTP